MKRQGYPIKKLSLADQDIKSLKALKKRLSEDPKKTEKFILSEIEKVKTIIA